MRDGLEKLGFEFVVKADARLPQFNTVYVPEGVDEAKVRSHLLEQYNLEIGGGLGEFSGNAWRIGLMGYGARRENVSLCLKALEESLR